MNLRLKIKRVDVNIQQLCGRIMNNNPFWKFAAAEWHRLYKAYVPFNQGKLFNTVDIRPNEIEHTVPYAHYQYTGEVYGPNYPIFSGGRIVGWKSPPRKHPTGKALKYKNPKAAKEWDKAAAPTQMPKLVSTLQNYVDSGRLKF